MDPRVEERMLRRVSAEQEKKRNHDQPIDDSHSEERAAEESNLLDSKMPASSSKVAGKVGAHAEKGITNTGSVAVGITAAKDGASLEKRTNVAVGIAANGDDNGDDNLASQQKKKVAVGGPEKQQGEKLNFAVGIATGNETNGDSNDNKVAQKKEDNGEKIPSKPGAAKKDEGDKSISKKKLSPTDAELKEAAKKEQKKAASVDNTPADFQQQSAAGGREESNSGSSDMWTNSGDTQEFPTEPNRPRQRASDPGAFRVGLHLSGSLRQSNQSNLRNSQLAVAQMVSDSPLDLPFATLEIEHDEDSVRGQTKPTAHSKHTMYFGMAAILVLIAVVVAVVVATTSQSTPSNQEVLRGSGTPAPTPITTTDPRDDDPILSLLPQSSVAAIEERDSPQAMAYLWLVNDPRLDSYPPWRIVQRYAMAVFYYATEGDSWFNNTNYLSYVHHECDWHSSTNGEEVMETLQSWFIVKSEAVSPAVQEQILHGTPCRGLDVAAEWEQEDDTATVGRIQSLRLLNNNVTGTLPPEMYLLTSLKSILFFSNPIEYEISSLIGNLSELEILYITNSLLSGSLPTELGLLTHLQTMELFSNEFSGPIPTELGLLSKMDRMTLDSNHLTGPVPTELVQLPSLHTLYLHSNELTGTLPTELGLLSSIYDLQIHTTQISGTVPTELFTLPQVGKLLLRRNALTGTIPTEIALLPSAWWIDFWNNQLVGTIPSEVGLMPTLQFWFSNENDMTGTIPSEFGALGHNLTRIYLAFNQYTGPLPSELGLCTKMEMLWLVHNRFEGDISENIFKPMTSLTYLQLTNNSFTGQIPTEVGRLTDIKWLEAGQNAFTGVLPSELGRLLDMSRLDVPDNMFQGTVPVEVANLTLGKLGLFDLTGNPLLSGTIPSMFCESSPFEMGQAVFDCTDLLCGCDCNCTGQNQRSLAHETL